ncbi:MAG: C_GCAxxG_C_C family protein [Clostridiales bacterium]|nr:C_GCAxxG_C_C family protein [Clostridiales bacterium]
MSRYIARAKELRAIVTPHYNCGQSVILPFAEKLGYTEETVMRFAANFGGGMKSGRLCGAVAGGAVVLGLFGLEDRAIVEDYYARLQQNHPESLDCAPLLALNEQRGGVKKPHCDALVYECIAVCEEMLREHGKLPE